MIVLSMFMTFSWIVVIVPAEGALCLSGVAGQNVSLLCFNVGRKRGRLAAER